MKKNLPFMLLLLLMACTLQLQETVDPVISPALVNDPIGSETLSIMKRSHKYPFDSAALLISDLLSNKSLNKLATTYALSGTFPAKLFRVSPENSGIILWTCFKPGPQPELFLALEQLKNYDLYNLPKLPTSKNLARPEFTHKNTNAAFSDGPAIETYLSSQAIALNGSKAIDNVSVINHINSFDSLQRTMLDDKGEKYNQYPFSYLRETEEGVFKKFLDQAGPNGFVRYYLGFDPREKANKIRVIFVAVDSAGKNITKINQTQEALVLQHTWPPPPPSN